MISVRTCLRHTASFQNNICVHPPAPHCLMAPHGTVYVASLNPITFNGQSIFVFPCRKRRLNCDKLRHFAWQLAEHAICFRHQTDSQINTSHIIQSVPRLIPWGHRHVGRRAARRRTSCLRTAVDVSHVSALRITSLHRTHLIRHI